MLLSLALACPGEAPAWDVEALQDPATCETCHPDHHRQWSGSMHAYAAEDPVFVAMNARGQRETGGALGDFCVRCHAPMAVELGLTSDGLDLESVPDHLRGVGCYFCHQVTDVAGEANNPLVLAHDGRMRGRLTTPSKRVRTASCIRSCTPGAASNRPTSAGAVTT